MEIRTYIRPNGTESALQSDISNTGFLLQCLIYFHFTFSVRPRFASGELAREWIHMSKMIDAFSTGFEGDFLVAFKAEERSIGF